MTRAVATSRHAPDKFRDYHTPSSRRPPKSAPWEQRISGHQLASPRQSSRWDSGMSHLGSGGPHGRGGSPDESHKTGTERLIQILELMAQWKRDGREPNTLCATAAEIIGVKGASIVLVSSGGKLHLPVRELSHLNQADRDRVDGWGGTVRRRMRYQQLCGCARPPRHPRRTLAGLRANSPASAGARAVFGFPIRIGAFRLGALCLHHDRPGTLTDVQTSDSHLMASVVSRAVLAMQSGAPPDMIAAELEQEATLDFAVHQAAGMVAVQGSMSIGDALSTLRAHAFATNAPTSVVARRVIARETHLDPITREWKEVPTPA